MRAILGKLVWFCMTPYSVAIFLSITREFLTRTVSGRRYSVRCSIVVDLTTLLLLVRRVSISSGWSNIKFARNTSEVLGGRALVALTF